ncbi:MAG: hypothetical protein AMXMBFR84_02080 [Candidatus Hydrogenedentota bacterium]
MLQGKTWMLVALIGLSGSGCYHLDHNLRAVEKDKFYRAGQMPDSRIGMYLRRHNVSTVVNLRGEHPDEEWWVEEKAVCDALGVEYKSFQWTMRRIPDPESLAAFVDICKNSEGAVLAHCHAGVHRAGTASAIYVLLNGGTPAEAREQFLLFFMDAPIGEVVDLYEGSPLPFDEWVVKEYPAKYAEWMEVNTD